MIKESVYLHYLSTLLEEYKKITYIASLDELEDYLGEYE